MIGCRHCGRELPSEKVGVRATCEECGGWLHACVHCEHYEPGAHNDCRETEAALVADKEDHNFCEYFRTARAGSSSPEASSDAARSALETLFSKKTTE